MYRKRLITMAFALAILAMLCPQLYAQDAQPETFNALIMEKGTKREMLVPGQSVILRHDLPKQRHLRGHLTLIGEDYLVVDDQQIALRDVTHVVVRDHDRQRKGFIMTIAGILGPVLVWTGIYIVDPDFGNGNPSQLFNLSRSINTVALGVTAAGITTVIASQKQYRAKKWGFSVQEVTPIPVN